MYNRDMHHLDAYMYNRGMHPLDAYMYNRDMHPVWVTLEAPCEIIST